MPSTANNDQFSTNTAAAVTGSVFDDNGSGADTGDALAITSVNGDAALVGQQITLASGALLTVNADGSFEYDPNGAVGTPEDSFTYQVNGVAAGFDLTTLDGTNGFTFSGASAYDNVGYSVSDAGDVNGDGFDDVIIGVDGFGGEYGTPQTGESYVVFGSASGLPANLRVSDLDGTNGFAISGIDVNDYSGSSVASAGDINGDGFDDLIIGARDADPNGSRSGESYVVFGSDAGFDANLDLADLNGSNGFVINGIDRDDQSGTSVASAGDINGDGFDDLIIGAPYADPNGLTSGETYVVFGSDAGFDANLDLADLNGTNGFVINGFGAGDRLGEAVASAGDINGDGFDDLIIGADLGDVNSVSTGQAFVVFGTDTGFDATLELSDLNGTNGFAINGIGSFDFTGSSVDSAGDINGDGFDDLIIGALGGDTNGTNSGESYVVFGSDAGFDANLNLSDLDGTNGFVINGIDQFNQSGRSVSGAGDVNGDGIDDLIIGARFATPNGSDSGEAYVVFGTTAGFGASLELSDLDGTNGFIINGLNADDNLGGSVSAAGDVNGDGFDDLIVGAPYASPNGTSSGESYIIFGGPSVSPNVATATITVNAPATDGNDLLTGSNGSDVIAGLGGDDTIEGGGGNDLLLGGAGADFVDGGDGTDTVSYADAVGRVIVDLQNDAINFGEAIGDTFANIEIFQGSNRNDQLRGDSGDNIFFGGNFTDRLFGRAGDDTLNGEGGADAIYGNSGVDTMTGGDDTLRDRFIYFNSSESGVGIGNRDIITDFTSGEDRIEISRFDANSVGGGGNDVFVFIEDTAFSNTAGELRFEQDAGNGITVVQADFDGDGAADFEIELTGVMTLESTDFLL